MSFDLRFMTSVDMFFIDQNVHYWGTKSKQKSQALIRSQVVVVQAPGAVGAALVAVNQINQYTCMQNGSGDAPKQVDNSIQEAIRGRLNRFRPRIQ